MLKVVASSLLILAGVTATAQASTYDCYAGWWDDAHPTHMSGPVAFDPDKQQNITIDILADKASATCVATGGRQRAIGCFFNTAYMPSNAATIATAPEGAGFLAVSTYTPVEAGGPAVNLTVSCRLHETPFNR